ncbi:ABC transporter substrate-binding protein [Aquabacterium sp.]|uniref:ABC transporter substrate-binding protein n=1 Tax=Aquabacterium sp. TaxID=1872578 RepID=UPI002BA1CB76|nr:extracellular solute-binding protein [Aquabacterium sp.]HSW05475.1 extracellular solute-binding protein [Aquabacterium sp.]
MMQSRWVCASLVLMSGWMAPARATELAQASAPTRPESTTVTVVQPNDVPVPRLLPPCAPAKCLFAGQKVTIIATRSAISLAVLEVKDEFEAATGAQLEIVRLPGVEHYPTLISDMTNRVGKYDASIAGGWWLGDMVAGGHLLSYDKFYEDPRFPKWSVDDVLPGPRSLLSYGGKKYMVAYDHDGQVMYYRRDLLNDPRHQTAFKQKYGYALAVPQTWAQLRDAVEYFNGQDLNGDGTTDHGIVLALQPGSQGMFNYMTLSASFVIGPSNARLYWFDPQTMTPLIDGPGHVRALELFVELVKFGPREMLTWNHGRGWDHFLAGRSAFALTWGDLGALAQQPGSSVKGKTGAAPVPGTHEYYDIAQAKWVKTEGVNRVGNTTGASWAGVISRYSKVPEATYFLLSLLATKEKSQVYAARGWDGIDPGRKFHFLPPEGTGTPEPYLRAGWDDADARDYLSAFQRTFNDKQQFPYLRIPGAYSYWLALDLRLVQAAGGQLSPAAALQAAIVDFEEITIRLGRDRQREAYRTSLGF